ncbi:MAG TPA: hypothetical protein PLD47_18135 [Aggregatilineales bacterium]|nr:hypothetical protein [Anaerolineales bacterium]HRE49649.1 hypothetical protein [Aggregatilineales bacterium]
MTIPERGGGCVGRFFVGAAGATGRPKGGRGVKTPALSVIAPLGLKTEDRMRLCLPSPEGVVTHSPTFLRRVRTDALGGVPTGVRGLGGAA